MPLDSVGIVADRHAVIIDLGDAYTKYIPICFIVHFYSFLILLRCGFATEHAPRFIYPTRIFNLKDKTEQKIFDPKLSPAEQYERLIEFFLQLYFK